METTRLSWADRLTALGIIVTLVGSAIWFYGEFKVHGARIESGEKDVIEVKASVKDISQELRGFRAEWKTRLEE